MDQVEIDYFGNILDNPDENEYDEFQSPTTGQKYVYWSFFYKHPMSPDWTPERYDQTMVASKSLGQHQRTYHWKNISTDNYNDCFVRLILPKRIKKVILY